MTPVTNTEVKSFWEANPVAAEGIAAAAGTPEFFQSFDAVREFSMSVAATGMCWRNTRSLAQTLPVST